MEPFWEDVATARFFRRLASFSRLVLHDKREQGLSDRSARPPTLEETRMTCVPSWMRRDRGGRPCSESPREGR